MSSKTLSLVIIVSVISVTLSSLSTYLILSGGLVQQERLDQLQGLLDRVNSRISSVESAISAIEDKLSAVNHSLTGELSGLRESLRELGLNVSRLSSDIREIEGRIGEIIYQTPADVYERVYRSVVTIRTPSALGSGFVYNETGLILTNWHVVRGETDIEAEFYDGTRRKAVTLGTDPYSDIALIRVEDPPAGIEPLVLGNSSNIHVGQPVVAIGNPLGLKASLSSGYISQINKIIDIAGVPIVVPVIQLDISIAPGSSGGPLLDLSGKVIGITNAGTQYGFNFAIPSNIIRRVASSLIRYGYYEHPMIGVYVIELTPNVIKEYNILNLEPFQTGLLVWEVIEGYPAAEAGLRGVIETRTPDGSKAYLAQDIILAIDGHPTRTLADLSSYLEEYVSPGQTITLTLWRSGETTTVEVTPTSRPFYHE
jgi:S1-C subfamily serine protease